MTKFNIVRPNPEIIRLRYKIDKADKKVLKLLKKRFKLTERLVKAKMILDYPLEDPTREAEIKIKWLKIFKKAKTSPQFIESLFTLVTQEAKDFQANYAKTHEKRFID